MDRYILGIGKFGVYFYDTKEKKDLSLKEVLYKLNLLEIMENEERD